MRRIELMKLGQAVLRAQMAPTRGRLKGIYPERKKRSSKSSSKQKSKKAKSSQQQCQADADFGGYTVEEELRQFDMDMSYGPCIGVTRIRRWERAAAMGLRPPPHLRDLILQHQQQHVGGGASPPPPLKSKSDGRTGDDSVVVVSQLECLWAGKV